MMEVCFCHVFATLSLSYFSHKRKASRISGYVFKIFTFCWIHENYCYTFLTFILLFLRDSCVFLCDWCDLISSQSSFVHFSMFSKLKFTFFSFPRILLNLWIHFWKCLGSSSCCRNAFNVAGYWTLLHYFI